MSTWKFAWSQFSVKKPVTCIQDQGVLLHWVNDPVQSILRAFVICISFWKVFYFLQSSLSDFFKRGLQPPEKSVFGWFAKSKCDCGLQDWWWPKIYELYFHDRLLRSIIATKRLFKMNFLLACFKALPKFGAKIIVRMLPIYRETKVVSSQAKTGRAWSECKFR